MGLFDALKRLFGPRAAAFTICPHCHFVFQKPTRWCVFCHNGRNADRVASGLRSSPMPRGAHPTSSAESAPQTPRPTGLENLDVGRFQPLSTKDARGTIQSLGGIRSAYLDSLGVIPDDSLPRIQIIDRTMVGAGLITAEELHEIHEVGRHYEELRGVRGSEHRRATEAVSASRAERQALKEQKKLEAAKRRQARVEEVARRKATDINFLGRGVSGGLSDHRANLETLERLGFPKVSTPANLAAAMGLSVGRLRFLAFHSEAPTRVHYVAFQVPKRSGGSRTITAPHKSMAAAQRWVLDSVLSKLAFHNAAHGFVCGRSTVSNAEPHVGADIVVNADLSDFFGTITFPRVRGAFRGMGFSPAVATVLSLLTTEAPRRPLTYAGETRYAATGPRALPQGACTSPALSNWITRRLDQRLNGIAAKLGWTYTRYADDLTFSARLSENPDANTHVGYLLARLRHIAQDEGFAVNEKKTRVLRSNARQSVTGIVVNDQLGVPRPLVRRIRAILHGAKSTGLEAQNREGRTNFKEWLGGMIAYIEMVSPKRGGQLREEFEALPKG